MKDKVSNAELVKFLKQKTVHSASFLDKLKIAYRPYVCPFDDILNYLDNNKSVFDFGCGSGMLLSLIDEYKMPSKLGGCEITEELVKNANAVIATKGNASNVYLFDGHTIPDEIATYDYITMIDVLHHIPKKNQIVFLKQLVSKMKIGSEFILKDIKKESILSYWNKIHDLLLAGEIGNEMNSLKLKSFFEKDPSLEVLAYTSRRMLLYPHFTLILKKIK